MRKSTFLPDALVTGCFINERDNADGSKALDKDFTPFGQPLLLTIQGSLSPGLQDSTAYFREDFGREPVGLFAGKRKPYWICELVH